MNPTPYQIILTAAFLGYHVTEYQAAEITALWRKSWDSMENAIRDYFAAYE